IGEAGIIHVRTPYLACGYHGDAALTAAKFIVNPYTGDATVRLYNTGDMGRYLPDGTVAYGGRADQQVKIRGFRVELGEVEAVLRRHPAVADVAVVAHDNPAGEKQLVAYLVPGEGSNPDRATLRAFVAEHLPDYMQPAAFVPLPMLPLTPNGKLDRRALPAPDIGQQLAEEIGEAPQTPTEQIMADIWAAVLGIEQIGRQDNFFEIGGHSLLATRVIAQIRTLFKLDLPLRRLFETPTVAGLTATLLADPRSRAAVEKTAQLLLALAALSDEEVEQQLQQRTQPAQENTIS
ncbi:MAG TPA: phosphopantetheine-binding protein, partial [Chloroflexota bacterium]|nr:phosphopantetheine-binding protein [Chloroflexota bacterium]